MVEKDFEYNDREYEAYKKYEFNGIDIPIKAVRRGEHMFKQSVMGEPRRIITKMIRQLAPDYSDKLGTKRDYLWYLERWEGVDFVGNPIPPVNDHPEGYYEEPIVTKIWDKKTNMPVKMTKVVNNQVQFTEYDKLKVENVRTVYYIPFSKETLDRILQETGNWENRDSIVYKLKITPSHSPDTFTYEQFANWDWKTAAEESLKIGGPQAHPYVPPKLEEPIKVPRRYKQFKTELKERELAAAQATPEPQQRQVQEIEDDLELDLNS